MILDGSIRFTDGRIQSLQVIRKHLAGMSYHSVRSGAIGFTPFLVSC